MDDMLETGHRSSNVPPAEERFIIDALPPEPIGRGSSVPRLQSQQFSLSGLATDSLDPRQSSLPALSLLRSERRNQPPPIASLAGSESLARGTTSRDGASSTFPSSSLRPLHGTSKSRSNEPRSASVDSRNSTQPVIVREYPHAAWSRPQSRTRRPLNSDERRMDRASLPPLTAFKFDSIMNSIDAEVTGTLDAIADICANNRYSLANQYEVHMPPGGLHAQTLRSLEQSLIPVSEVSSERGSASPTNSRKSGDQVFSRPEALPEPGEAAMDKLLSSSLAGGNFQRPKHRRSQSVTIVKDAEDGKQHDGNHQPGKTAGSGPKISPVSLAANNAFLINSSHAFNTSRSKSHSGRSSLGLLGSRRTKSLSQPPSSSVNVPPPASLESHKAPEFVTVTGTGVRSGVSENHQRGQVPDVNNSGAFRAVSMISERSSTHEAYLSHFLPSWLSASGTNSATPNSNNDNSARISRHESEAEGLLRGLLNASRQKTRS